MASLAFIFAPPHVRRRASHSTIQQGDVSPMDGTGGLTQLVLINSFAVGRHTKLQAARRHCQPSLPRPSSTGEPPNNPPPPRQPQRRMQAEGITKTDTISPLHTHRPMASFTLPNWLTRALPHGYGAGAASPLTSCGK